MAASPTIATNLYGEQFAAWTDGLAVYIASDAMDPQHAFDQDVPDGSISLGVNAAGILTITYLDDEGNRLSQSSLRDGITGSWS